MIIMKWQIKSKYFNNKRKDENDNDNQANQAPLFI